MPDTKLLEALQECGSKLPESSKPAPADMYNLVAGLLYWLETGSTVAPEPAPEASVTTAKDAEIARLEAELAAAQQAAVATPIPPSPVAPAPTEPVTPQQAPSVADPVPAPETAPETVADPNPVPPASAVPSEPIS
jgi:hypothetical protein